MTIFRNGFGLKTNFFFSFSRTLSSSKTAESFDETETAFRTELRSLSVDIFFLFSTMAGKFRSWLSLNNAESYYKDGAVYYGAKSLDLGSNFFVSRAAASILLNLEA